MLVCKLRIRPFADGPDAFNSSNAVVADQHTADDPLATAAEDVCVKGRTRRHGDLQWTSRELKNVHEERYKESEPVGVVESI
jgi:hypothetical protein